MSGAAYAAWVEKIRLSRMNGRASQWWMNAIVLKRIQSATTIVWPMMYLGVPKKRAVFSAKRPKVSSPNGLRVAT